MPLAIKEINGFHCPHVICDFCGKAITKSGNVAWLEEKPDALYFVHHDCWLAFERANPGFWFTQPLPAFLEYLLHNACINRREAARQAQVLGKLS